MSSDNYNLTINYLSFDNIIFNHLDDIKYKCNISFFHYTKLISNLNIHSFYNINTQHFNFRSGLIKDFYTHNLQSPYDFKLYKIPKYTNIYIDITHTDFSCSNKQHISYVFYSDAHPLIYLFHIQQNGYNFKKYPVENYSFICDYHDPLQSIKNNLIYNTSHHLQPSIHMIYSYSS